MTTNVNEIGCNPEIAEAVARTVEARGAPHEL